MSLKDKLRSDSKKALKIGDKSKVSVLRFLISLLDKKEMKLPPGKMTEAEALSVLAKELKNKNEAREMFGKAGRDDLVEESDYEISILKTYLPEMLSTEAVEKIVDEVMAKNKETNFGQLMKMVMAKLQGKADGTMVVKIVKSKIGD